MSKSIIAIALIAITSSMIAAIGHDAETSTLRVEFKPSKAQAAAGEKGTTYDYSNVNTDLFKNLSEASSVGSFLSKNIKAFPEKYPATQVHAVKVEKAKEKPTDKA